MKKFKRALFIGRFQPFHNGHLDAVKQVLQESERVIILIGSAEKNFMAINPLTAAERFQIIEECLKDAKIPAEKYDIIPMNNIGNFALWLDYISAYIPPCDVIYTGSQLIKNFYAKKIKIVQPKRTVEISATEIREAIINNGDWEKFVPKKTTELFKKWKIPARLKNLQEIKEIYQKHDGK